MRNLFLLVSTAVLFASTGCSTPDEPSAPPVVASETVTPQAYTARTKISPPSIGGAGSFDCDDFGDLCWCVGDDACNEMFEDLPCNTLNSWCNQDMNKCFCDINGGSFKDYQ